MVFVGEQMKAIESFLDSLKHQKNTTSVTNPYHNDGVVNNLRLYLKYMFEHMSAAHDGRRVLLVGEAPGYRGCRITGIPFSSVKVLMSTDHPLFLTIRSRLSLSDDALSEMTSENTATIVWQYLAAKKDIPLFWNSFPFHPHPKGQEDKNRAPNSKEVAQGMGYLQQIYRIFQPEIVAGVGTKGVECARKAYPELSIKYIRHPSYGGKAEFIEGMDSIIQ